MDLTFGGAGVFASRTTGSSTSSTTLALALGLSTLNSAGAGAGAAARGWMNTGDSAGAASSTPSMSAMVMVTASIAACSSMRDCTSFHSSSSRGRTALNTSFIGPVVSKRISVTTALTSIP